MMLKISWFTSLLRFVLTLSDSGFRKVPCMTCSLAIGFLLNFVVENSAGRYRFILEYALIEL